MSGIRSRKVRRILKLEARAAKLRARYETALERIEPLRRRLEGLQKEARALEGGLTRQPARRAPAGPEGGPVNAVLEHPRAASAASREVTEAGATAACSRCGQPLEVFTLDLPLGLGPRTWPAECPCETKRREADLRQRRIEEHRARIRRLLAQAGIGARHGEATFETFEVTPASAPVLEVCRAFVGAFPDGGQGLTLSGPPGTGKTHLVVALTRALIERGFSAVIVNVPRLLLIFRSSFHGAQPHRFDEMLELLTRCDHLVLDDLGRERQTEWVQETLYLVINARYEDCLATTVTTNLAPEGLRLRLGEPILDRLAETNAAYWCQWPSYRRRRAG
jgi:DNA replication protein DnaC